MNVTIESPSPCRRILKLQVPSSEVQSELGSLIERYSSQVKIPGFRPGKAPRHLVQKRYQKQLKQDLQDVLIPRTYQQAVEQEKLPVVSVLGVEDVQFEHIAEDPLCFRVVVDVRPEFDLPEYKGLPLEAKSTEVEDEDVENLLEELRKSNGSYEEVTEGAVEKGNLVQVDFQGTLDGQPVEELSPEAKGIGSGSDFWMMAEEDAFLPGFADALEGSVIGDQCEFEVTFPDHLPQELAGRTATYQVTVKGIRIQKLAELDESFYGLFGVDNEEALRELIRSDLAARKEQAEQGRQRNALADQLLKDLSFDLPEQELETRTQNLIYERVREATSRGMDEEKIKEHKSELFDGARTRAENSLRLDFVFRAIADKEDISVTQEEFEQEIAMAAQQMRQPVDKVREQIHQNGAQGRVEMDALRRKVYDFLLEHAQVKG